MAALYSAQDYTQSLLGLRPEGLAWPEGLASVQYSVLSLAARTYERTDGAAQSLLVDAFPSTAVDMLYEWELALGLPDPCAGEAPTLQQRQAQVVARLAGATGQSAAWFIGFAAQLGYEITISTYAPFRAGRSRVGDPLYGDAWAHTWSVQAALNGILTYFRAGRSAAGEPLRTWGSDVLECEFRARAPAHTVILFQYA